jgi:23S rRNA (cytidine1920-2'-O)/16S rRNA (cytidine1409-2'-O)-methyltransferase
VVYVEADRRVHWVSRSAEKLAWFLDRSEVFSISQKISSAIALDIGASTGWFTQVLLQYGAKHIDAVDVWSDQLHPQLRSDPRVRSYEGIDIREFPHSIAYDTIVCDASFISLHDLFDSILSFADNHTFLILLYKPQFEVWRSHLRKTGVPKDEKYITQKRKEFEIFVQNKWCKILHYEKSSLLGEAGNQEWIYALQMIK